jgi:hypothetical protein
MDEIISKIKKYYTNYLTGAELASLSNISEFNLRILVNKIWESYLSNILKFKNGEPFKFLAIDLSTAQDVSADDYINKEQKISLFDSQSIKPCMFSLNYLLNLLVTVDFEDTDQIYLPVDFEQGDHFITGRIIPQAIIGGEFIPYDVLNNIERGSEFANNLEVPFLITNLNQYPNCKFDVKTFTKTIISTYLMDKSEYNSKSEVFYQNNQKRIRELIQKQIKRKGLIDDEFIGKIYSLLNESKIISPNL